MFTVLIENGGTVADAMNNTSGWDRRERTQTQTQTQRDHRTGRRGRGLTCVGRRAFANGEDGAEVLLVLGKALLQALEFPEALAALVLHGAHMLNQVELGLGGVVAQHAVVVAGIALHRVLVLLQVLREAMETEGEAGRSYCRWQMAGQAPLTHFCSNS